MVMKLLAKTAEDRYQTAAGLSVDLRKCDDATAIPPQEPVISDDASREKPFSADEYVASRHVRSVLFLPLIKQAKLVGVLYIENNVAASVFTRPGSRCCSCWRRRPRSRWTMPASMAN